MKKIKVEKNSYEVRFPQLSEHATILDLIQRVNQLSYVFNELKITFNSPHSEKVRELKKLFGKDIFKKDTIDTVKVR
jgi:hypothetical protein